MKKGEVNPFEELAARHGTGATNYSPLRSLVVNSKATPLVERVGKRPMRFPASRRYNTGFRPGPWDGIRNGLRQGPNVVEGHRLKASYTMDRPGTPSRSDANGKKAIGGLLKNNGDKITAVLPGSVVPLLHKMGVPYHTAVSVDPRSGKQENAVVVPNIRMQDAVNIAKQAKENHVLIPQHGVVDVQRRHVYPVAGEHVIGPDAESRPHTRIMMPNGSHVALSTPVDFSQPRSLAK